MKCQRCDRDVFSVGLCWLHHRNDRAKGLLGHGASPDRIAKLKRMEADGELADHCRALLAKIVDHV